MSETSERRRRILIVGGYGMFGGRITELLADESQLELIVAGRSSAQAQVFCAHLKTQATLRAECFDRAGDVLTQLRTLAPDIVVDASGPFQTYGDDPYRLVKAAIALGINYLDIADGSAFVEGITQFDATAKKKCVFVLSGVSSFPVLTAAVCRQLAKGLKCVDTITGGIAPSPYAGVGLNVVRAIASYAGKPLRLIRDGRPTSAYGLTETKRATIGPPGRLPLRSTLFSLVDVPDLAVLPQQWPQVRTVWMGAGPVPAVLHRALICLAWSVRLRLLPSLTFLAPLFFRAINTMRWGEHRGGMFVAVDGASTEGATVSRSWHLVAEGDDGPLIPLMAVEAIICKCLAGVPPLPGARSAISELELDDYNALFARRAISHGFREASSEAVTKPLYRRLLGSAFDQLPGPIRSMHDIGSTCLVTGAADVERGCNLLSKLIGLLFGFPEAGQGIPLRVRFTPEGDGGETWQRSFGARAFSSHQVAGIGRDDKLLVETFGPFAFALALVCANDRLSLIVRRWSFLGLPMPSALAPYGDAFECVRDGKFYFNVEICLPIVGLIVRYRGSLERQASETSGL